MTTPSVLIENLLISNGNPESATKLEKSHEFDCLFKFMDDKNIPYKWFVAGGFMAYVDNRTSTFNDIDVWIDISSTEYLADISKYLDVPLGAVTHQQSSGSGTGNHYSKVDKVIAMFTIGMYQLLFTCYAEKMDLENYMDTIISEFDLRICAVGFNPITQKIVHYNIKGSASVAPERLLKYQNRVLPDSSVEWGLTKKVTND